MRKSGERHLHAIFFLGIMASASAQAFTVAPAGPLTASGSLGMTKGSISLTCTAEFTGEITTTGAIVINSVRFSGKNFLCKKIKPLDLPWSGQADSNSQITIHGLHAKFRGTAWGGKCGPTDLIAVFDENNSSVYFRMLSLPPNCTIDGVMVTVPAITITP